MEVTDKKPRKKPNKIEEMTKEQIRQAILKKRECNTKCQKIVESLLEKGINEDYFLQCLPDINLSHLEDTIEERSIIHICGFPLCDKDLCEKDIPKQKYRISVKTNKVYDITARKKFCSNSCYKSAIHVKKQMLTSPLWFREYEEIPTFHLLPDSSGSMGQEVDVALVQRVQLKSEKPFTSINDFTHASLNEMTDNKDSCDTDQQKLSSVCIEAQEKSPDEQIKHTKNNIENPVSQKPNPFNIIGEIIEKPEKKIDPILMSMPHKVESKSPNKIVPKKWPLVTVLTIEVEKCLAEWFTIDTLLFLFGDEKVREMVVDKGDCIKEYLNNYAKGIFYNSNTYDQYQALCRKLNMLELEDKRNDGQTLHRETKPLPDYSILQEESKNMELKVKAFLSGATEVSIAETHNEISTKPTEYGDKVTNLPLVDKNAQNALRRRIVCQHLNKVLPDLLGSLGLQTLTISVDTRLLVNTFKLKANNIMFKPVQWTLIAMIFIKLLSLKNQNLEYLLEQPMAFQHMQLLLLSYKQDGGYLDRLIGWLTDVDRLLDTNDTQLTVE